MTPRPHARTRRAAAALLIACAGLVALAGCDPRALLYFLQPDDPTIPPPKNAPDLKGKRVVILAHSLAGTTDFVSLDRDITREFIRVLRDKVKKIDVVNPEKVSDWVEGHPNWTDPAEAAKAFEADFVIFLEVEQFQIQGAGDLNMLHGLSKTHIQAIELAHPKNSRGKPNKDLPKESDTVYDAYQDSEFPIRGPMPIDSGISRGAFKSKFIQVAAAECSWHFVEHAQDDMIQDTKINNR